VVAKVSNKTVGWALAAAMMLAMVNGSARRAMAQNVYVGALGGLSTLSADGRPILTPSSSQVSLYKPQNGPALSVVAGWDFSRYVSVQGNYIWNGNDLTLVSTSSGSGSPSQFEETRSSQTGSLIGDLLVYVRERGSRVRPYLSCGTGVEHFSSSLRSLKINTGSLPLPQQQFSANNIALRVGVGIDAALGHGWAFRYTFSEMLTSNPISQQLTPPGLRKLKNFQSLFGVVKRF
jgi:Outer membrane protein beta-barrel domain